MWKVGEIAAKTGLSIRTLHHYDEIGLLSPTVRTEAGHRKYSDADVQRLQQIVSLKQLGLSLEQIKDVLENKRIGLADVLRMHAKRVDDEIRAYNQVGKRLRFLLRLLDRHKKPKSESLFEAIKEMEAMESVDYSKYYTPEQLKQLDERGKSYGDEAMRAAEKEWQELIAKAQRLAARNADPAGEEAQKLAKRWNELIQAFTGGDKGIEQSLSNMYSQEKGMRDAMGMDEVTMTWVGKAMAAAITSSEQAS